MKISLPLLKQELVEDQIISEEIQISFDIDTSVYSEERWEQNFPELASREGLFQYIERIDRDSISARVKVASMLKAIFCFIESTEVKTYKEFAQMFNLAAPDYTERLINKLRFAFNLILNGSSVKN